MYRPTENPKKRVDNHFFIFLKANYDCFTDKNKKIVNSKPTHTYIPTDLYDQSRYMEFANYFDAIGFTSSELLSLVDDLKRFRSEGNELKIPASINKEKLTLSFNQFESFCNEETFRFYHEISSILQLKEKIVYLNCAVNAEERYRQFCTKHRVEPKLICLYNRNPYFHSISTRFYKPPAVDTDTAINEQKLYCTFNWNPASHRFALIALLNFYDLIDDGEVSSPEDRIYPEISNFQWFVERCARPIDKLKNKEKILNKLTELEKKYPLRIDNRPSNHTAHKFISDETSKIPLLNSRKNSLFEIITETSISGDHFFSEKTFMSILFEKPFLMVNSPGSLKSLKKLGYKTFAPFLNESYDSIEDDQERILAIVRELKRLKTLRDFYPKSFLKLYQNVQLIAEYNKIKFINDSFRKDTYDDSLIKKFINSKK